MPEPRRPVKMRSIESMKALTHPLRREILNRLSNHGQANSTTLAEAMGQNTGTISYHLRQLERFGFVEEVPDQTNGRERWWRTVSASWQSPDPFQLDPEDQQVLLEFSQRKLAADLEEISGFLDDWEATGRWSEWSRAGLRMTREELTEFYARYMELIDQYGHDDDETAPPDSRRLNLRFYAYPQPEPPE